jgi:hypothetical protein
MRPSSRKRRIEGSKEVRSGGSDQLGQLGGGHVYGKPHLPEER